LSVKDDGAGIPKEQQKNLFLRFYEGEYRKFNTIGTGIGLSLTKDLVELHGGTITVESGINKGTTFFVKIPIKKEAYKDENIDENVNVSTGEQMFVPESEEKENSHPVNKEYSLLLLEDNEELLRLMVKLLSVNYIVFTGTNGKEGLEIIEQEDVDLIVSDIMMPEMDGIEFCRHIKNSIDTCHIPIILLTAKNNEEDRTEAYDSGANAFISKPFNLSLLHSRISNLLKARERVNRDFKKQLVFETQELNYTSKDEKFLQEAIRYVNDHLTDGEIDTPNLYKALNISKATLYRKLKSLTGLNVTAFVRNIRLKAACRIMDKKKNIRISEVAYAVGFNDPKYFSVCFKKELGMHPSDYLDQFADSIDLDEE
jgi:CheY-like chemotaxis protein